MQPFQIFRPGRHTAASGAQLEFTEQQLRDAIAAYDPALHEAPIVVGHPKDNGPAFGWVSKLDFDDSGALVAEATQVDADFAELVSAGRYKKRSASWYLPDSPSNPKPGVLYLRHVGFLGAQPPAIKGLKEVAFSDTEEGVIEFVEGSSSPWAWSMLSGVFRGLREYFIAEKGVETADKLIPTYVVDELKSEGERKNREIESAANARPLAVANQNFNETEGDEMDKAELERLKAENEQLKAQAASADFSERENALREREQALLKKEIEGVVDGFVKDGKVLPAHKASLVDFMASLPANGEVVEFGEAKAKLSPREFMTQYLSATPKIVDFSERSGDQPGAADGLTAQQIADKARHLVDEAKSKGESLNYTEAVMRVHNGQAT